MTKNMENANNAKQELLSWLRMMVCVVLGTVLLFTLVLRIVRVDGASMRDTLQDGDIVIALGRHLSGELERGDIIVVQREGFNRGQPIVKRVIATEGQTVDIDFGTGIVYVDGVALEDDYTYTMTNLDEGTSFPQVVEKGHVFLMGDNRNKSKDSRSPEIGQVDEREILGKAIFLFMPGTNKGNDTFDFSRIGVLG